MQVNRNKRIKDDFWLKLLFTRGDLRQGSVLLQVGALRVWFGMSSTLALHWMDVKSSAEVGEVYLRNLPEGSRGFQWLPGEVATKENRVGGTCLAKPRNQTGFPVVGLLVEMPL